MAIGDEYIDIHANMDPFDREVERGARSTARDADGEFKRAGKQIGETMGESASDEFGHSAPKFGRKLQEEVRHRPIRVKQKINVDYDVDSDRLGAEIHSAIDEAFAPGGPVDRIGRKVGLAFGDAFGAGFGISGRSALIPFIVVLVGALVGLIVAAVQAVNALVAVLTTLPALLLAVGLQAGVLVLAFKGMGTAITGAFAAKNAKELNEAIKGLTPSAREFVRTLLPLRDLFSYLKAVSQEAFFKNLGPVISEIQAALGNTLGFHLGDIAAALGRFARAFALVFASPAFVRLLDEVIPATVRWLDRFGPGFAQFLLGLIKLADSSLPFLSKLGDSLSGGLEHFGEFLDRISKDKKFQKWLNDMFETLGSVGELFLQATMFVASFMDALNENGGKALIDEFSASFAILADFFQTEAGQEGVKGFVNLLILMVDLFTGLILLAFGIIGAITAFVDFLGQIDVAKFFEDWQKRSTSSIMALIEAFTSLRDKIGEVITDGKEAWLAFQSAVVARVSTIIDVARSIPGRIKAAIGNLRDLLYDAGRSAIQGLINGILSMGSALRHAVSGMVGKIAALLPGSPAKEGPLSGQGYSMLRGQRLVQDLVKGIKMETPALRSVTNSAVTNITFGTGSVSVGFQGVVPTPEQARVTGAAAGQGILGQLAQRDTRLAVRTL
jgi:hypothetical protein